MDIALFCDRGLEQTICDAFAFDDAKVLSGCILVDESHLALPSFLSANTTNAIVHQYYTNQWATKILAFASVGQNLEAALDSWELFSHLDNLKDNATFAIKVQGLDFPEEGIKKVAQAIGKNTPWKVNLSSPDILVYIIQRDGNIIIGVDLAQNELFKREYRIYTNPSILRSTVAFGALLYGKLTHDTVLLDPFAGSGTVGIEAALHMNSVSAWKYKKIDLAIFKSGLCTKEEMLAIMKTIDAQSSKEKREIYVYDHLLKRVQAITYNAKIAGVLDFLNNSKIAIDWVDTKFDEESVDLIVTQPPILTKETQKNLKKCYEELAGQLEYLLKPDGCAILIVRHPDMVLEALGECELDNSQTLAISQGQEPLHFMKFEK